MFLCVILLMGNSILLQMLTLPNEIPKRKPKKRYNLLGTEREVLLLHINLTFPPVSKKSKQIFTFGKLNFLEIQHHSPVVNMVEIFIQHYSTSIKFGIPFPRIDLPRLFVDALL